MIDLIVFAALAVFVVIKLKKMLGEEYSYDQASNIKDIDATVATAGNKCNQRPMKMNIIGMANKNIKKTPQPQISEELILEDIKRVYGEVAPEISAALLQLYKIVPGFNCELFKHGAVVTFESLLDAYSHGKIEDIKAIAKSTVADNFTGIIEKNATEGVREKVFIVKVKSFDILKIQLAEAEMKIEVKFESLQVSYSENIETGVIVDGSKSEQKHASEIWTFSRPKTSQTPDWFVENIEIYSMS